MIINKLTNVNILINLSKKNDILPKIFMRRSHFLTSNFMNRINYKTTLVIRLKAYECVRCIRTVPKLHVSKKTGAVVIGSYFNSSEKNKKTFIEAINKFHERERQLRGHVEFIYSALEYLEEFGVERDLEVYKSLLNVMPKGKMVAQNIFQVEFAHYPKHQQCAVDVLEKMERLGVLPDSEVQHILVNTFGKRSSPVLKFARMMYWMPKIQNASPWPLPRPLPDAALELAKLALIQINSVDPASKTTIMETNEVIDAVDKTWIVSSISPEQQKLISELPPTESLKVEGPFGVFLREQRISYFILRAEPKPPKPKLKRSEIDDVSSIFAWVSEEGSARERELIKARSVHEQEDGTLLATCATGTSSRDSLLSWIRLLEKKNPALAHIPVLFTQSSPIGDVIISRPPKQEEHGPLPTNDEHT